MTPSSVYLHSGPSPRGRYELRGIQVRDGEIHSSMASLTILEKLFKILYLNVLGEFSITLTYMFLIENISGR